MNKNLQICKFRKQNKTGFLPVEFLVRAKGMYIPTLCVRGPLSYRKARTALCAFLPTNYSEPSLSGSLPTPQSKNKTGFCRLNFWCGRRESNPRLKLGKLSCCHYTTPANLFVFYSTCWQMSIKIFLPLSACF